MFVNEMLRLTFSLCTPSTHLPSPPHHRSTQDTVDCDLLQAPKLLSKPHPSLAMARGNQRDKARGKYPILVALSQQPWRATLIRMPLPEKNQKDMAGQKKKNTVRNPTIFSALSGPRSGNQASNPHLSNRAPNSSAPRNSRRLSCAKNRLKVWQAFPYMMKYLDYGEMVGCYRGYWLT